MTAIHAETALLPDGLHHNVRIAFSGGVIDGVETDVAAQAGDERHGFVLPAVPNLHSHAFQRAMAGLAETRGPGEDSFWSWRTTMYRFALSMAPEHVEAVAAQLYMEMLEAGFGRVGEFHYLHHDADGSPYADPAEMAVRIAAASAETGIGLTLLPVFYAHSGFGAAAPAEGQRRFINDIDGYGRLMERAAEIVAALPGGRLGIAPHSLRAVTPGELAAILPLAKGGPVHIHVAEQVKEVEDCVAWSGARPVEWLLANAPVDGRWCLIHATHLTAAESRDMARSGAVAGLCPITEANLGDGIFDAPAFLGAAKGRKAAAQQAHQLIGQRHNAHPVRSLRGLFTAAALLAVALTNQADHRFARPFQACVLGFEFMRHVAVILQIVHAADTHGATINPRLDAASGYRFKILDTAQLQIARLSLTDDSLCQRML